MEIGLDDDGWIVAIGRDLRATDRHDFGESVLLPAATDLHVHFRSPDSPRDEENWASGTRQAALGGVALAGDMPNTEPPVSTASQLQDRAARGRGRLAIDLFLYAAAETPARIANAAREAGAFKLYMAPTTGVEPGEGSERLGPILEAVADTGLALAVHAEDPSKFGELSAARTLSEWSVARSPESELAAIDRLLEIAPPALRLHITHATSVRAVDRIRSAGHFVDSTPHHLLLAADRSTDPRRKVNPPLRPDPEPSQLWKLLQNGSLPALASDHAPHSLEAKGRPFAEAPAGMPGVGTLLPLLLARVRTGELELGRLLDAACDRPARWFGAPHGRLQPGHRAHVLVVDFRKVEKFRANRLPGGCGWSAFEGWDMIFPREHWHHGERIVHDGEYVGRPGGRVLKPDYGTNPRSRTESRTLDEE